MDLQQINALPLEWHATTQRLFACQAGCVCCCTSTIVFPSEARAMPIEIRSRLSQRNGLIRPALQAPGVCIFFDSQAPWHCTIPEHRPLRCRLYPYLPVVTDKAIVIVADPLCTISWPATDYPEWYRCYGLGRGPDVAEEIGTLSRRFLTMVCTEAPQLLAHLVHPAGVEEYVNSREVAKSLHPKYPDWDTEAIRLASALEALAAAPANAP
jgi:hypothetical protein